MAQQRSFAAKDSHQPMPMAGVVPGPSDANIPPVAELERRSQPIGSLSPFIGAWWIKARVMEKTPIKTWNNPKGSGQLFACTLMDSENEGRTLGVQRHSTLFIDDPNLNETKPAGEWWKELVHPITWAENLSATANFSSGAGEAAQARKDERKALLEFDALPAGQDVLWGTSRVVLGHVKDSLWYIACTECNKKAQPVGENGTEHHCVKCDKQVTAKARYILQCTFEDPTRSVWATAFDDQGCQLLGIPADSLQQQEAGQPGIMAATVKNACFKQYIVRFKMKEENVMDDLRNKIIIHQVQEIDYVQESTLLLKQIATYLGPVV
eukprot:NODE_98_length_1323_cov_255.473333_g95_i0.p1 GENE.NODE_98_length_1323_cov_255.473333_g95_i0~~NODE_98_length_1323_cov_255.473333_g95_i0.p1  ORF type:complete len:324 (-),score=48.48 NODE_98_length_1323_cov_255.473333_g95_i0:235-1206(-)